ncbi:MAG: hypothetical protein ACNI3A_07140 [Desulfovibrio sp.]|uniref:hypothetical protein n=1 Tax=Desulfovibrio sp. 7SRBS1 TaxID=3378064 RepID=UPI003B41EE73
MTRPPSGSFRIILPTLLCLAALGLLGYFEVYQNHVQKEQLEQIISERKNLLAQQELLRPFFNTLKERQNVPSYSVLPGVLNTPLPPRQLYPLINDIMDRAARSGFEILEVAPQSAAFSTDAQAVIISCRLKGEFTKLRDFLLKMAILPYANTMRSLSIREDGPTVLINATFRFQLAQRSAAPPNTQQTNRKS